LFGVPLRLGVPAPASRAWSSRSGLPWLLYSGPKAPFRQPYRQSPEIRLCTLAEDLAEVGERIHDAHHAPVVRLRQAPLVHLRQLSGNEVGSGALGGEDLARGWREASISVDAAASGTSTGRRVVSFTNMATCGRQNSAVAYQDPSRPVEVSEVAAGASFSRSRSRLQRAQADPRSDAAGRDRLDAIPGREVPVADGATSSFAGARPDWLR
jgi:hypothetical protein